MDAFHLTDLQKDILKEIGNIGAGNAATSLSQLLGQKIDMMVPNVEIADFNEVIELVGGPEQPIVGLMFQVEGEMTGVMAIVFDMREAEYLVQKITYNNQSRLSEQTEGADLDIAMSALSEIGNILTGSYLTALSDFTGMNLQPSVPHLGMDMAGAIMTMGLLEISQVTDYAIIIDTEIRQEEESHENINGNFLFIPDPSSFQKLFAKLGWN
ncbi:chemotaxis protein CheC [Oceanobacillus sp. J11TS1]|uniref:chemotaxis protein CheC n=1 Tax=Oceanobacillus sp. J11TS1 TaxID=2807191 RepID=UPI001B091A02|nr:chemotaxis protein CheC [Oceanobacillus sp. J11TS1]GIO21989.1 CheY-P phosphatase CheC [Oceanobacillus sp. J11TS1]